MIHDAASMLRDWFRCATSRLVPRFPGSRAYWERRYAKGGNSGAGSYGRLCEFKAEILNSFCKENAVGSVVEFGCGDGHQLTLAQYPLYLGLDVSPTAIARCRQLFAHDETKRFALLEDYDGEKADLALSLDVVFHLVEDSVFEAYMRTLFASARSFVIVYSSDCEGRRSLFSHVRHRCLSAWVAANERGWRLAKVVPNQFRGSGNGRRSSFADFFVYERA
jgi:hypothetical protein